MDNGKYKGLWILVAIIIIGLLAYGLFATSEQPTAGEKIGAAVNELTQGADKAVQDLNDAAKDAADKVKEETKP